MSDYQKRAIKKVSFISKLLISLPFVRCVILNGSLASGTFKITSDIDLLIIARDGRIFTTRFFTVGLLRLLGIKRSKNEAIPHAGKFCLNYFLTESFLKIPTGRGAAMDSYCAVNYSASKLTAGSPVIFRRFIEENNELWSKYSAIKPSRIVQKNHGSFLTFQKIFELLLCKPIGEWVEKKLKIIQIKSIESDPRTKSFPRLIVYNDQELRFHPPKNK